MATRTPPKHPTHDPSQVLRVARSYYLDDESKVAIAERELLSRWQVARILEDARASGLVRISVGDPAEIDSVTGAKITSALGLAETIVVGRSRKLGLEPSLDSVGEALARYLSATVLEGDAVGLTWSRAIESMAAHLDHLAPCDVVQLAGALTLTGNRMGSVEIIRHVARLAHGTAYPIYAPLVVESPDIRRALEQQAEIAACLKRAADLSIAVVSVGTWSEEGSSLYPLVPAKLAQQAAAAGAVGEISGRVFTGDGALALAALDDRVLGISAEQLRAVPHIVATSYGAHRVDATIAAARAGYAHTLIIDSALADAITEKLGL
ncbi:sugar-binding transcriptional regulator [Microterricola pindariensis]|uniref:sugar-binding transcriptional regulator n=1 Tax=Microterricola pindariensis TaxID=478010 RepID=UPI001374A3BE|nr:sugar-binding domain-containing protein [Microterricola pindariensis]